MVEYKKLGMNLENSYSTSSKLPNLIASQRENASHLKEANADVQCLLISSFQSVLNPKKAETLERAALNPLL